MHIQVFNVYDDYSMMYENRMRAHTNVCMGSERKKKKDIVKAMMTHASASKSSGKTLLVNTV